MKNYAGLVKDQMTEPAKVSMITASGSPKRRYPALAGENARVEHEVFVITNVTRHTHDHPICPPADACPLNGLLNFGFYPTRRAVQSYSTQITS